MLTLLFAAALAFPVPASPPIPVSTPVLGRPAGDQRGLRVASNGSIDLAVWDDGRNGDRYDVTACRIAADGTLLDPVGLVLRTDSELCDVFWTGSSFAVVTAYITFAHNRAEGAYTVTYFDPNDGTVSEGATLSSLDLGYGGHVGEGAGTRLLFLQSDGSWPGPRVVDLQGKIIGLVSGNPDAASRYVLAATNGFGFLAVHESASFNAPTTYTLEAIAPDGNSMSWRDPHLPSSFIASALTGDAHGGYALFGYLPSTNGFVLVRLNASGVVTAPPQLIQTYDSSALGYPSVFAGSDRNGFFASWAVAAPNGHTQTYLSRNGGVPELMSDRIGICYETHYEPAGDLLFTSFDDRLTSSGIDVFVQKGSGEPAPLTYSTNDQAGAAVAAGTNGFLAAWTERSGSDSRLYVRRFSTDGQPVEEPQIADTAGHNASIASSGGTYLIAWGQSFARRLDAGSGRWLDETSFPLRSMAAASNGTDFLALTLDECPQVCTTARRVSMTGNATVSDGVKLSDSGLQAPPAIASDGQNYLAVWIDAPPNRVLAMRLRPDGSHIDAAPIVVESSSQSLSHPSVAWNGKTYLVAWATAYYGGSIDAAYVASDASVQRLDMNAKIENPIDSVKAVAHADTFVIFSRHATPTTVSYPLPEIFNMTLLDGSSMVFGQTRTIDVVDSFDAASDGLHLMLAYARVDPTAGRAHRVVLDPRIFPSRQRAVR